MQSTENNSARMLGTELPDVWSVLSKYKRVIGGGTIAAAVLATIIVMTLHNEYTATVVLLPEQQGKPEQQTQQTQLAQTILAGGTLQDSIIRRFDLMHYYDAASPVEAREMLRRDAHVKANKDGSIVIEVSNTDPVRAADMANAYPEEYKRLVSSLGLSATAKTRAVLEARKAALRGQQELYSKEIPGLAPAGGVSSLETAKGSLKRIAVLRAQLDSIYLDTTSNSSTANQEWWGQRLNSTLNESDLHGDYARRYTERERSYLELYGRISYVEASLELLKKRDELLRAEEDANAARVLDPAVPPEKPTKPKRILIVAMAMIVTAILLSLIMLFKEWLGAARKEECRAGRCF